MSEVADITGVPSRTLRAEILAGRLVAISLTHRPRPKYVTAEAVNVWLREEWY